MIMYQLGSSIPTGRLVVASRPDVLHRVYSSEGSVLDLVANDPRESSFTTGINWEDKRPVNTTL